MELDLKVMGDEPIMLRMAKENWDRGDIEGVLVCMSNETHMAFLADNFPLLKDRGLYEKALLRSYRSTLTNHAGWSLDALRFFFEIADIEKLRLAGDPIPTRESFTLYRGVSGVGRARRVNGISWTESPNIAAWFAKRFAHLPDPAVFTVTVPRDSVMACTNGRNEKEYLLKLPLPTRPKRLKIMPEPHKNKTAKIADS